MIIIFALICLLGGLYIVRRLLRPLTLAPRIYLTLAVLLLVLSQLPLLLSLTAGGNYAAAVLSRTGAVLFNWAFGALVLLFVMVLLRDVLLGLLARLTSGWRIHSKPLAVSLVLAAMGLSAVGVWQAVKLPAVKSVELVFDRLPPAFDGYRIVQLSDQHASDLLPASWQRQVVTRTNSLKPDLIVITGDLQDGEPSTRKKDVLPMQQFKAVDGVLAVPGNHEYYTDYSSWISIFRQLGLDVLENQHRLITRGQQSIALIGLTDRQAGSFGLPSPDLAAAMKGLPTDIFSIVLSHQPNSAATIAKAGVDLELAGHTHGGQVLGLHWVTRWANRGFVSGRYQLGNMTLYVSNGTGLWSGFALRLGKPSEITEITLRRR